MVLKELTQITDPSQQLEFLKANKAAILKEKKGMLKRSDSIISSPKPYKADGSTKAATEEADVYRIVGNSAGFMDSHMDVSLLGSYTKTVRERGDKMPILINHNYNPKSIFAKNLGAAVEMVNIRDLGYDKDGMTEALLVRIEPKYDQQMKELYRDGQIKEHSIGLRYVKIELAINDPAEEVEYAAWQKYLPQVINSEVAEQAGYFFAVSEQKVEEVSAVVFGSNAYTPTLNEPKNTQEEPHSKGTPGEPSKEKEEVKEIPDLVEMFKNL